MKISVIVPVFNGEKYLNRSVDSILSSTYDDLQVILVDDGSTDNTWKILKNYKAQDKRVEIIHKNNGGLSCARNAGIEIANGEYLSFVDADDRISKDIYEKCVQVIKKYKPDLIHFKYSVEFNDGRVYAVDNNDVAKNILCDRKYLETKIIPALVNIDQSENNYFIDNFVWNKLYKTEIIKNHDVMFNEKRRKWEDRLFLASYLRFANTFYSMGLNGIFYYITGNSLSSNFDAQILNIIIENYELYNCYYGDKYDFQNKYTINYFCNILLSTYVSQFNHNDMHDTKILLRMTNDLLDNKTAQMLFRIWQPKTRIYMNLRKYIIEGNKDKMFSVCKKESQKELLKSKVNKLRQYLSFFKRMINI